VKFCGAIYSRLTICQSSSHCSSSFYLVHLELWYWNLWTRFLFSGAPEPPSVVPIICFLWISRAPDTRVMTEFWIFIESTLLNMLQSIAQENRCQLLDTPETDSGQYISNHPSIERLFKRYPFGGSYPMALLACSRLTRRILPSISSLRNGFQAHLRPTLLPSLIVSDLKPHAYSIHWLILTSRHSLLTYDPTPGMPLNHV